MKWLKKKLGKLKRRIIRWYYKPARAVQKRIDNYTGKIQTIVLIKGHKSISPGANSVADLHEFDYWGIVNELIKVPNKVLHFVDREGTSITGAVNRAAAFKPDLIIEEHFNAFNGNAHGVTSRYATASAKIAEEWCVFTAKYFKSRNRKGRNISDVKRGVTNVLAAQRVAPKAFLIEPFFGDAVSDYVAPEIMAKCLSEYLTNL